MRFIDNFSAGHRGALSTEQFLEVGPRTKNIAGHPQMPDLIPGWALKAEELARNRCLDFTAALPQREKRRTDTSRALVCKSDHDQNLPQSQPRSH